MDLKSFLKKNKVFSALLITFLIWISILVILAITANRVVTFYDWVDEKDVSSHYTSEVPILRYFIEPLVGFALILGGYDAIIGFFWTLIIYRIVYFLVFLADGLLILLRFAPKMSVKDTNADSDSTRQFNTTDEE